LDGNVVRGGQLTDRGVTDGQPRDDVPPGRVGQRSEHAGKLVVRHRTSTVFNQSVVKA
jgi:hypothetical protein